MTIKKVDWDNAFLLLNKFERQVIEPADFSWAFIVDSTGISKATLWRNKLFMNEFNRVGQLIRGYRATGDGYGIERSLASADKALIESLRAQVEDLTVKLNRERERIIYAAMIARRKDIDPRDFMEGNPLEDVVARKHKPKPKIGDIEVARARKNSK